MRAIARSVLAVLLGLVVGFVLVAVIGTVSHQVFPPPPGIHSGDPEAQKAAIARIPLGAFLFILVGWSSGALAGSWLAARIAIRSPFLHGLVVGMLFVITGIAAMFMLPHPLWFRIVGTAAPLLAGFCGAKLGVVATSRQARA